MAVHLPTSGFSVEPFHLIDRPNEFGCGMMMMMLLLLLYRNRRSIFRCLLGTQEGTVLIYDIRNPESILRTLPKYVCIPTTTTTTTTRTIDTKQIVSQTHSHPARRQPLHSLHARLPHGSEQLYLHAASSKGVSHISMAPDNTFETLQNDSNRQYDLFLNTDYVGMLADSVVSGRCVAYRVGDDARCHQSVSLWLDGDNATARWTIDVCCCCCCCC
jgi:hypothetical protein